LPKIYDYHPFLKPITLDPKIGSSTDLKKRLKNFKNLEKLKRESTGIFTNT